MNSDVFVKIVLLGICVCIINLILKRIQQTFVIPVNIIYIVIVIVSIFDSLRDKLEAITNTSVIGTSISSVLICVYKSAAICILTKIASDICRDSGNATVSDIVEFSGRIALLFIAFPFIESVIETATSFVK